MKKKILVVGAVFALSIPFLAFADGKEEVTPEQTPEVTTIEQASQVNNEMMNNRVQGRQMSGQGMPEQRIDRENELRDNVKEYAPESVDELEALIEERERLREQNISERNNQAVRGNGYGHGNRHGNGQHRGHGMMHNGNGWNADGGHMPHCQDLNDAIVTGDEEQINERIDDILTHKKERNQELQDRLNEQSK